MDAVTSSWVQPRRQAALPPAASTAAAHDPNMRCTVAPEGRTVPAPLCHSSWRGKRRDRCTTAEVSARSRLPSNHAFDRRQGPLLLAPRANARSVDRPRFAGAILETRCSIAGGDPIRQAASPVPAEDVQPPTPIPIWPLEPRRAILAPHTDSCGPRHLPQTAASGLTFGPRKSRRSSLANSADGACGPSQLARTIFSRHASASAFLRVCHTVIQLHGNLGKRRETGGAKNISPSALHVKPGSRSGGPSRRLQLPRGRLRADPA